MKNLPRNLFNTSFMSCMKVFDTLVNPKGMTNHSYNPSLILETLFHSSPSLMQILWYPLFKYVFVKYSALLKLSMISSILGNRNLYLIVIFLIAQEFVHILHSPLFFGANTASITHELRISQIKPFCNNS